MESSAALFETNGEVLVSYLDGPAKSGAEFARLFTEESGMRPIDVVERGALRGHLEQSDRIRAIVVVDDFVGTGGSASSGLQSLHDEISDIIRVRDVKVVFACVAAFADGWNAVRQRVRDLKFGVEVFCCDLLDDTHRLFGERSRTFPDSDEREKAKTIASRCGAATEKHAPLGFGNLGLAVVFERGCPNNTLPILWGESSKPLWRPLFPRH